MSRTSGVHIAQRCDLRMLIDTPEVVLQQLSFKVFERREQALKNLVGKKVTFYASGGGIEQGVVQSVSNMFCVVKVHQGTLKVSLKKIIL